jgi:hypothetical protein
VVQGVTVVQGAAAQSVTALGRVVQGTTALGRVVQGVTVIFWWPCFGWVGHGVGILRACGAGYIVMLQACWIHLPRHFACWVHLAAEGLEHSEQVRLRDINPDECGKNNMANPTFECLRKIKTRNSPSVQAA